MNKIAYRLINSDIEVNADGVRVRADDDGCFRVAPGSRVEEILLLAGAVPAYKQSSALPVIQNPSTQGLSAGGEPVSLVSSGGAINFRRSSLRKTLAAIDKIASGGTWTLGAVGDSTTAGGAASPVQTGGIAQTVRSELIRRGFANAGSGLTPMFAGGSGNPGAYDTRLTYTGTWNSFAWGSPAKTAASGSVATLTFASDVAGDTVEVWYYDNSASFSVAVDGGTASNVVGANTGAIKQYTASVASATHTIVVNNLSTACCIVAIGLSSTAGGMKTANLAQGGAQASANTFSSALSVTSAIIAMGCQTCLVGGGYNDMDAGGKTVSEALASVTTTAKNLRAAGIEVILLGINPSSHVPEKIIDYNKQLAAFAIENDYPMFDSTPIFGSQAQGVSDGYYNDQVHLKNAGSALQGRKIASALLSL